MILGCVRAHELPVHLWKASKCVRHPNTDLATWVDGAGERGALTKSPICGEMATSPRSGIGARRATVGKKRISGTASGKIA